MTWVRNSPERNRRTYLNRRRRCHFFQLCIPHEDWFHVTQAAKYHGLSINELIQTFIVWSLDALNTPNRHGEPSPPLQQGKARSHRYYRRHNPILPSD